MRYVSQNERSIKSSDDMMTNTAYSIAIHTVGINKERSQA